MRLNSRGQVTVPAELRRRIGLREGDEIDVVDAGGTLQIVRSKDAPTRGERAARRLRGTATAGMSTDEIMGLLRDE
jgi:AbrB family looped-hinge helix DNA binding protein